MLPFFMASAAASVYGPSVPPQAFMMMPGMMNNHMLAAQLPPHAHIRADKPKRKHGKRGSRRSRTTAGAAIAAGGMISGSGSSSSSSRSWRCTECAESFPSNQKRLAHMKRKHPHVKIFKCPMCPREFRRRADMNKHVRIHTGERPYECDLCGRRFKDSSNRTRHRGTTSCTREQQRREAEGKAPTAAPTASDAPSDPKSEQQ